MDVFPAWSSTVNKVASHHGVDLQKGLTEPQVQAHRRKYGYNELVKQPGKPLWRLVLEQFDDMLVKVLLLAAVVSFALAYFEESDAEEGIRAYIEPAVILLILVLNAIVGVWQESNAEAALEALKEMQPESAQVIRGGNQLASIPARELLPGDVVELHVGDRVPADIRIARLATATLRAEQASLTGESVAVGKRSEAVTEADCDIQDKECMLFAGTAISNGSCVGIVNSIGMQTEIGKIQQQIQEAAEEEEDSPLKKKIDNFGERLAQVIFIICILVWLINYHNFLSWRNQPNSSLPDWSTVRFSLANCIYYFKIAVALAVAAIPEGLPAVITTCLALGTRKMAKRNAIVRISVLVYNRFQAWVGNWLVFACKKSTSIYNEDIPYPTFLIKVSPDTGKPFLLSFPGSTLADLKEYTVEGTSFNPAAGGIIGKMTLHKNMETIAEVCTACNDARIEAKNGIFRAVGAPTEAALVVLAEKLGLADEAEQKLAEKERSADELGNPDAVSRHYAARLQKLATLEFDRHRKSMSVICSRTNSHKPSTRHSPSEPSNILLVKGAAECILARCNQIMLADGRITELEASARSKITGIIESMAKQSLRCLAFASKTDLEELAGYNGVEHPGHRLLMDPVNYSQLESELVWLGVAGLQDPPRPEVASAIAECHAAGIHVVVITGDNKLTGEAICREIGIFGAEETLEGKSMTGRQFVELGPSERRQVLQAPGGKCFSRAEPKHKQDIVRVLKEMGEIVAMTGDGVNDAPALKLADIGIAMGVTGTEVAKEAADMVLADDNFSTIVAAVEEGRAIYNNMKAFIRYMISSNIGEVACIFLTAALGLPENLIPVQLLWVNLVTDGPPATALGFNPPDLDIMQKPPRRSTEELVTPWIFFRWLLVGAYVGFATVGAFASWYMYTNFMGIDLSQDGHSTVTWHQLSHWNQCQEWKGFQASSYTAGSKVISFDNPCGFFHEGKAKASTLSLSVLVAIEMFNALNALSEDNSLLQMPPWCNPWLLCAMALSFGLHFVILYVPVLADIFSIVPLSFNEWLLVILFALPVVFIDEVLKFIGRNYVNTPTKLRRASESGGRMKED